MKAKSLLNAPFTKWWIPYFILIAGLSITFLATLYVIRTTETQDRLRFSSSIQHIQDAVNERLSTYTALLQASAGLFDASEVVTQSEFKNFADRLEIRRVYPGIQGIGYVPRIRSEELESVTNELTTDNTVINIRPNIKRDEYYPILYIEPLDSRNIAAVGYDMYTESTRRTAMNKARDTGKPAISGKVTLIQEIGPNKQSGFLIYVPLYSNRELPQGVEERRRNLRGFVYSPFRAGDFFNGVLAGRYNRDLDFKVYDARVSDETLLHDSGARQRRYLNYTPSYSETRKVEFAGESWIFVFNTRPAFEQSSEKDFVPFIFVGGIVMSMILFSLSQLQYAARRTAELHSEEMYKSEQALQKSNSRVRDILESITDGFIAFNKKWKFTYVNHEASRILGKPADVLIGKFVWKEFPELEKNSFGKLFKKSLRYDKPMALEDYFEPLSGWLSARVYPSRTGLSIYLQNITERKEQERRKDEFISIASHELKTPVTTIKAFTQLLQRKFSNKTADSYLIRMNEQINKLTILVNDLLDVSKIQAGKLELRKSDFSLTRLLRNVIEALQETTTNHKINFSDGKNIIVHGDEDRIEQVIINLLTNAMKYSQDGKPIDVVLREEKKRIVVAVRDYGRGIEKEYQKKVFERFFRVKPSAEKTNSGLGMGLYISVQIISRHNGEMWVESSKGKGSTFYFSLPRI